MAASSRRSTQPRASRWAVCPLPRKDVDRAVAAARKAFNTTWGRNSSPGQRAAVLFKLAELMEQHAEELSELESLDNGKPRWIAETMDIADTAGCFRYYAGLADKIEGKTIEQKEGEKLAFTRLEPLGVCGQIIPWNYPIGMLGWKVAPALAAGNCIVLKPAEQTPLSALRIAQLAVEAGLPAGVLNVVNGLGPIVGDAITGHMDVDKVAFTGSTAIGKRVMERAARSNLKKVTLELGGKSPVVVFEDADIDQAVNWAALGILFNQGQDCTAGSRLFVQESIYDTFVPSSSRPSVSTPSETPLTTRRSRARRSPSATSSAFSTTSSRVSRRAPRSRSVVESGPKAQASSPMGSTFSPLSSLGARRV